MDDPVKALRQRIFAARQEIPAQLVLKRGRVVNVFSGEIQEKDVALYDGFIVGVGHAYQGEKEVDLDGKWVVPGLIDGHIHIESSMLVPSRLAEALLLHGTTAIVADPHEIANVMGLEGIDYMLKESGEIPFDVFFLAPSCVPATHLETSGQVLMASDLAKLKQEPRILGLAEMMNFPGVLMGEDAILEKIILFRNGILDGHAPLLMGHDLQAYCAAGIRSDHEASQALEAFEKLASGMMIMIREGSSAKNLEALLPLVNPRNERRFCFVSDDLHAEDIQNRGHLDFMFRKAVQGGLDPVLALRLATINPAEYFGLKDRGAVAPGFRGDLVVLENFEEFRVTSVYKDGNLVVDHGQGVREPFQTVKETKVSVHALNMAPLALERFRIPHLGGKARIIEVIPGQITTALRLETTKSKNGWVVSDIEKDILKICVIESHRGSGQIGLGLVRGFGLRQGAIASSIAHDSHNVIVVGVHDGDILKAAEGLKEMGGGLIAVRDQRILGQIPLEIAGLMSIRPLKNLVTDLKDLKEIVSGLGCVLEEPFMTLSFLALPVIPELKLTDKGLVDVRQFEIVPLFLRSP